MTKQNSIQQISAFLGKPGAMSDADLGSIASFRQSFPYFVPVRYMDALANHRKSPFAPAMLSAVKPYMGDWIMFYHFLQAGSSKDSTASRPVQPTPEVKPKEQPKVLKSEKQGVKEVAAGDAQPLKSDSEVVKDVIVNSTDQPLVNKSEPVENIVAANAVQPLKSDNEVVHEADISSSDQPLKTESEPVEDVAANDVAQPEVRVNEVTGQPLKSSDIEHKPEKETAVDNAAQPEESNIEVVKGGADQPIEGDSEAAQKGVVNETGQPLKSDNETIKDAAANDIDQPFKSDNEIMAGSIKNDEPRPAGNDSEIVPDTTVNEALLQPLLAEAETHASSKISGEPPVEEALPVAEETNATTQEEPQDPFAVLIGEGEAGDIGKLPDIPKTKAATKTSHTETANKEGTAANTPAPAKSVVEEIESKHWIVEDTEPLQPILDIKSSGQEEILEISLNESDPVTGTSNVQERDLSGGIGHGDASAADSGQTRKEEKPLIYPVYTEDYFLQQGVKVSPEMPDHIDEFRTLASSGKADKSLMVMMSFAEWLMHFKSTAEKQKEETKDQKALKSMWQKEKLAAALEEENEEIPENVFEMAVNSIAKEDGLASESLAEIYIKQEKYDKAIEMYRKLSLRNPQKNAYFARKIEEILKEQQS